MKRILCLLLLVCLLSGCKSNPPISGTAPDFAVLNASGKQVELSDYFGKPIVVNLCATWCPPCKAELPYFDNAYNRYGQVQFLMVNLTVNDSREDVKKLMDETGYTFPVFYDITGSAAMAYNAQSIPMTIFINAAGDVVSQKVGAMTEVELESNIQKILQ